VSLTSPDLFEGLPEEAIDDIIGRSRHREFAAHEVIVSEGDPGDSVLILEHGAAEVLVGPEARRIRRLRRGDVIGEISLLTGEPRSATIRASVATTVVEIQRDAMTRVLAEHPVLLTNLSRILSRRLARAHVEQVPSGRGEAVGLILGRSCVGLGGPILAAAMDATPRTVGSVGLVDHVPATAQVDTAEAAAEQLDPLLSTHGFVFVVATLDTPNLATLVAQVDRTVAIGKAAEVAEIAAHLGTAATVEAVLIDERGSSTPPGVSGVHHASRPLRSVRSIGRHVTRTKVGLALGAGGAKGYAHVGALAVLEKAGYTVDRVAGSSIGAVVGACIAMGMGSAEIEENLQERFSPEVVKEVFALSFAGTSTGYDTMRHLTEQLVGDRTFDDLEIPFVAMAVDLVSRLPVPISEGRVADALLASTALAGLFPPFERGDQRLVDGLALIPVPVGSVIDAGADITISVNLMSRDTLAAWPGEEPSPPPGGRQRMLETLLEVMDLTQLDASVRNAAEADVVITPRFGPCTWRDFHLADRFITAGREAAEGTLPRLQRLTTPTHGG
jgi:NTE family protein